MATKSNQNGGLSMKVVSVFCQIETTMDNVTVIPGNLPNSRIVNVVVFPDSTNTRSNAVYLLYKDSNMAHSLEFSESRLPKFVEIRPLVFPCPPVEIFSLASCHWAFLENGCIYKLPDTTGNASASLPKASNFSTGDTFSSQVELEWPNATSIPKSCKLFQNERCRSVCSLRNVAFLLSATNFRWSVNIYKCDISTSNEHTLLHMHTVDLPHVKKKPLKPCMVSFALGDGDAENEIDSQLCKCIFGGKLPLHCEGLVLVAISDGEVFSIPVVSELLNNICAFPLFCFHEPVVKIQKVSVKTGNSRNDTSILFVGVSGKVIILSRTDKPQETGPNITEFHVPGPIQLWSGCGEIAFHTDGFSSLWKTIFKKENTVDKDSNVIGISTIECVRASGICLFNNQEQGPHCLLFAKNGNLIYIKNCNKSGLLPAEFCSHSKPMDVKQILTAIHECSEHLSKIYLDQESKKKILCELSCAAHLILNDKARKMLTFMVLPEWTSAEPNQITVAVKVSNESNFNIIGNHWHFVLTITTASGRCLTKSVPLHDFQAAHKVDGKIKITVGDSATDNDLPFQITGSLQLFLNVRQESMAEVQLESSGYKPPVSFLLKLSEARLDELSFLSTNVDAQLLHHDPCIGDALWELARSRPALVFHDLEILLQAPIKQLETSIFNFVTVRKSIIKKILKKQGFPEGPLTVSLLAFIVGDSKIVLPSDLSDVELSVFGHKVKLVVREDDICVQIKIIVWCPSLLPKLRFAILQKLQFKNYQDNGATVSKQNQIGGFLLKSTVASSCLALNSRLRQLSMLQQENQKNLVSHIYAEMRELVSAELPFV